MNFDISIVMCCFNGDDFLNDSLNSLLKQTKTDFEFIFINDGSSDRTESIVLSKSEEFRCFKYIYHENLGLQKSRNVGLACCSTSSRFVMFVDSDDTYDACFVEILYDQITSQDNIVSVHCNIQHVGTNAEENNYGDLYDFKLGFPVISKRNKLNMFDIISGNHRVVEASGIYRKSTMLKFGGWDERNFPKGSTYGESIPLLTNLVLEGELIFLNNILYNYRIHENQITKKSGPNLTAIYNSTNTILSGVFSTAELYCVRGVVFFGVKLINFTKRFKYLGRYRPLYLSFEMPTFCISYIGFQIFKFILKKNIRVFLFKHG